MPWEHFKFSIELVLIKLAYETNHQRFDQNTLLGLFSRSDLGAVPIAAFLAYVVMLNFYHVS